MTNIVVLSVQLITNVYGFRVDTNAEPVRIASQDTNGIVATNLYAPVKPLAQVVKIVRVGYREGTNEICLLTATPITLEPVVTPQADK